MDVPELPLTGYQVSGANFSGHFGLSSFLERMGLLTRGGLTVHETKQDDH